MKKFVVGLAVCSLVWANVSFALDEERIHFDRTKPNETYIARQVGATIGAVTGKFKGKAVQLSKRSCKKEFENRPQYDKYSVEITDFDLGGTDGEFSFVPFLRPGHKVEMQGYVVYDCVLTKKK